MDRYKNTDEGTDTEAQGALEQVRVNERVAPEAGGPAASMPDPGWANEDPTGIDNPANLNAYQDERGAAGVVTRVPPAEPRLGPPSNLTDDE
ncbi:MAG: hypothetical protein IT337_11600 [Thermomicrobiales bacterium]|nr:hypothetical protein [Thermomicrobiales bacterium]